MDERLSKLNQLDRIELLLKGKIVADDLVSHCLWNFIKFGFMTIIIVIALVTFYDGGLIFLITWLAGYAYFYFRDKKLIKEAQQELQLLEEEYFSVEPRRKR